MKDNTKKIVGASQSAREKFSIMIKTINAFDATSNMLSPGKMVTKKFTRKLPVTLRPWDERNQNIGTDKHSYINKGNTKPEYPKYEK